MKEEKYPKVPKSLFILMLVLWAIVLVIGASNYISSADMQEQTVSEYGIDEEI